MKKKREKITTSILDKKIRIQIMYIPKILKFVVDFLYKSTNVFYNTV